MSGKGNLRDLILGGLDWADNTEPDLAGYREGMPDPPALQGNLDPAVLNTTPENTRRETRRILESMRGQPGYIFNLGHGIQPQAKVENVAALVETVRNWK